MTISGITLTIAGTKRIAAKPIKQTNTIARMLSEPELNAMRGQSIDQRRRDLHTHVYVFLVANTIADCSVWFIMTKKYNHMNWFGENLIVENSKFAHGTVISSPMWFWIIGLLFTKHAEMPSNSHRSQVLDESLVIGWKKTCNEHTVIRIHLLLRWAFCIWNLIHACRAWRPETIQSDAMTVRFRRVEEERRPRFNN